MSDFNLFRNGFENLLQNTCGDLNLDQCRRIMNCLNDVSQGFEFKEHVPSVEVPEGMLPSVVEDYFKVKKVEGMAHGTIMNSRYILLHFCHFIKKPLNKTTTSDIRSFLTEYQDERGISNATLDNLRKSISAFFHWMANEEMIDKDPSLLIKPNKFESKPRQPLTQIELEHIRRACVNKRDKAIIEFYYSTGCRVSELSVVKKSDINLITDEVQLFGKGSKYRTSFINAKAHVAIEDYLDDKNEEDQCEYLFTTLRKPYRRITKAGLERIMKKIVEKAGITNKKVTPHVFRHTTATMAVANGMNVEEVQKLLGHVNISTTMRYVETSLAKVKSSHKRAVI